MSKKPAQLENHYDDVRLDVVRLLDEQTAALPVHDASRRSADGLGVGARLRELLERYATGRIAVKLGLHRRLIYANLRLDWFDEFYDYWVRELGNRAIVPHDFGYLYANYRRKAYAVEISDDASDDQHLAAWQDHRMIWAVFMYHYAIAIAPFAARRFIQYVPAGGNVCEYGCGLAPVTTMLARYYRGKNLQLTAADLPALMFHFVRWKFREQPFVRCLPVDPTNDAMLDEDYDTIFCLNVFEHLPRPLAVIQHFYQRLKQGGYLIFDYPKTEGLGLDTQAALEERDAVFAFIAEHFQILQGEFRLDPSMAINVVAQKKTPS